MKKQLFSLFVTVLLFGSPVFSQDANTQDDISRLVGALLGETPIEQDLQELCDGIGGRVTGTDENLKAVDWAIKKFEDAGVTVKKEGFKMPALWVEKISKCEINGALHFSPKVVSLSLSPKTPSTEAKLIDGGHGMKPDFEKLGSSAKGNFILVETEELTSIAGLFKEYENGVMVEENAKNAGAAGVIYMSSRPKKLLYRHNAAQGFDNKMPLLAMAREDAQRCFRSLRKGADLSVKIEIQALTGDSYTSYNVIGEIKGSEKPDEFVLIGSHIDSWGLGTGAEDNGCNVTLMLDIARQIQRLGIKPKRTIRFALWNGEELGFFGSLGYIKKHAKELDKHIMATSIDIGSGRINGFFTNGRPEVEAITSKMLEPVKGLGPFTNIDVPIVGTDNFDFMMEGIANLVGSHEPGVYAANYHAESDTYDKVNFQSLKVNSAIVAAVTLGFANVDAVTWKRQSREEVQTLIDNTDLEVQMKMFNVWEPWIEKTRGRK